MKKYLFALVALLSFACGSVDGSDGSSDDGDIDSVAQGLKAPTSPTLGFGAANSTTHAACLGLNAPATQACLVPKTRSYTYCTDPGAGFTTQELANIDAAVATVELNTTFSYTKVFTTGPTCKVLFNNVLPCSGTCSSGGVIDTCVCSNPTVGALVTESLPGTYSTIEGNTIHLDKSDANAHFSGTNLNAVEVHGFAHQLALLQGVGAKSTASVNDQLISGQGINPVTGHGQFSSGEMCKMTTFTTPLPTQFSYSGTCPSD